jgi:hypothetical protein
MPSGDDAACCGLREWLARVPGHRSPLGRRHPPEYVLALAICAFTTAACMRDLGCKVGVKPSAIRTSGLEAHACCMTAGMRAGEWRGLHRVGARANALVATGQDDIDEAHTERHYPGRSPWV